MATLLMRCFFLSLKSHIRDSGTPVVWLGLSFDVHTMT